MLYNAADNVINIRDIHKPRGRALDIFDPPLPSWTVLLNKDNISRNMYIWPTCPLPSLPCPHDLLCPLMFFFLLKFSGDLSTDSGYQTLQHDLRQDQTSIGSSIASTNVSCLFFFKFSEKKLIYLGIYICASSNSKN